MMAMVTINKQVCKMCAKSAKLLECACLFWRSCFVAASAVCASLELVFRPVLDLLSPAQAKAAEGQPQSKTLARVIVPGNLRSFWSAPVFSGALVSVRITSGHQVQLEAR
jgi:hypothetical protein